MCCATTVAFHQPIRPMLLCLLQAHLLDTSFVSGCNKASASRIALVEMSSQMRMHAVVASQGRSSEAKPMSKM